MSRPRAAAAAPGWATRRMSGWWCARSGTCRWSRPRSPSTGCTSGSVGAGRSAPRPRRPGSTPRPCYGPNLRAVAVYLVVFQHVPVERAALLIADLTGAAVSTGWVSAQVARAGRRVGRGREADQDADHAGRGDRGGRDHPRTSPGKAVAARGPHRPADRLPPARQPRPGRGRRVRGAARRTPAPWSTTPCRSTTGPIRHRRARPVRSSPAAGAGRGRRAAPRRGLAGPGPPGAGRAEHPGPRRSPERPDRDPRPTWPQEPLRLFRHAVLVGLAQHRTRPGRKQSKARNLLERLRDREPRSCGSRPTWPYRSPTTDPNGTSDRSRPRSRSPAVTARPPAPTPGSASAVHLHRPQTRRRRPDRATRRDHRKPLAATHPRHLNGYLRSPPTWRVLQPIAHSTHRDRLIDRVP